MLPIQLRHLFPSETLTDAIFDRHLLGLQQQKGQCNTTSTKFLSFALYLIFRKPELFVLQCHL